MPKQALTPIFFPHHEAETHSCQLAKCQNCNNGHFFGIQPLNFLDRKFGEKIRKNSGRAPAFLISEIKLSYGSRIARYKNCLPNPLGGGKNWGSHFLLWPKISGKGGLPYPKFYIIGKLSSSTIRPANLVFLGREIRKCRRLEKYAQ